MLLVDMGVVVMLDDAKPRRFSSYQRIRKRTEFELAYREGARVAFGVLLLVGRANGSANSRLGIAVGRRLGNAVRRNRLKRWAREMFRSGEEDGAGIDVVLSFRDSVAGARYADVVRDYRNARLRLQRRVDRR